MIDWLTLCLPAERLGSHALSALRNRQSILQRTNADGEIEWRTNAREEIRHGRRKLTSRLSAGRVELSGSPARVTRDENVFGERDVRRCAHEMIRFFEERTRTELPHDLALWNCTRLAVTLNYALSSAAAVVAALHGLAVAGGPRLVVSTHGDTVYWNRRSKTRAGMAYHKGPQFARKVRKGEATASPERVAVSNFLLRLELSLGAQFWRERAARPWHKWTVEELEAENQGYFAPLIASVTTTRPSDVLRALKEVTARPSLASTVYRTLLEIQSDGLEAVRPRMANSTFHRHRKLLFQAGLTWADLNSPSQPARQSLDLGEPVHEWDDLALAA